MADTVDLKSTALGHEGSNPSFPTIFGLLAQQVEQWTFNPTVKSSILLQTTIIIRMIGKIVYQSLFVRI